MRHILRKSPIVIFVLLLVTLPLCPFAVGNWHYPASAASSVSPDGWGVVHSTPANQWVRGVWGTSSSDVFAVGHNGAIFHFDGHAWSPMTSGTQAILWDVWGSSGSDVWAVGSGGTILHYDGNSWSDWSLPGPNAPWFAGVWGSSSSDIFFVGSGGNIIHYTNGSTWDAQTVGTGDLADVWGNSGSDVYAVGDQGTILHFNGSGWSPIGSATSVMLRGVWGSSSYDIFAVGDYGTIVHFNTGGVISLGSYGSDLYGVWGSSLSDIYAVGSDGTILHHDGAYWSPMDSGVPSYTVSGVWGYYPDYDIYVTGAEGFTYTGIILHYPSPTISTVSPDQGIRGQTLEVTITGTRLDGVNDMSDVSFGAGITVNSLPFQYSTEIRANITISPGAALGLRDVSVSDSGDTYTKASAFEVVAPPAPTVSSVNPSQGAQGQTLGVTISGTNLSGATAVSFGNGITVNTFNPNSPTQISANISIGGSATLGARNVSVTTGGGTGTKISGFTVVATAPSDTTPPAAITSLAASGATTTSVTLTWTAPGDDGNTGTASSYDIRYSTATITEANWGSASQCSSEPAPLTAGADQAFTVTGLSPDTTYYFAMKTADEIPNWSGLSNVPSRKTEAVLPANQPPDQPTGLSPVMWSNDMSLTTTLQASVFSDADSGDHHTASQWHIDDDPWDFTSPAFDSGADTTNLTSISVPSGKLNYSTLYYWRVRHQDSQGAWSDWSVEMCFATSALPNQQPAQPGNTSPADGATGVSLVPTLTSSPFSDPDAGDHHAASQWQIDDTPWDYLSPAFDSGTDTANLTSITVPSGKLTNSNLYWWRVRYQDGQGAWSDWSTETSFSTTSVPADSTPPTTPTVADDGASTTSTSRLHAAWTSSDAESGIAEFQYAIGTTSGGTNVVDWTSAGTDNQVTATGLSLSVDSTYYFSVKAMNGAGLWSAVAASNGIKVIDEDDTTPTPAEVDGNGLPFWVWILVALGVVGVGAGGLFFWKRRKVRSA